MSKLLKWAKKAKPLAKVGVALASIALNVCTGLTIPAAYFEATLGTKAGGALSEFVEETLTSGVAAMASVAGERLEGVRPAERLHHAGAHRPGRDKVKIFFCDSGLLRWRLSAILGILDLCGWTWWNPSRHGSHLTVSVFVDGKMLGRRCHIAFRCRAQNRGR